MITDAQIVAAYHHHGSVWRAGEALGIAGQAVSKRMRAIGQPTNKRWVSDADLRHIREFYETTPPEQFDLDKLAAELGRTRQFICRLAGREGLTFRRPFSEDRRADMKTKRAGMWSRKPHPRGFAGSTHSAEARVKISTASKVGWATQKTFGTGNMSEERRTATSRRMALQAAARPPEKNYSRAKGGRRHDLGETYFRSSWEANYARYLNLLMRLGAVERWEFEPITFWFEGVKRGTVSYKPDFRVFYKNDPIPEYIELKGWVVDKDHTKWRRMAKYHPDIKLVIIKEKQYKALKAKWASSIPNWESNKRK